MRFVELAVLTLLVATESYGFLHNNLLSRNVAKVATFSDVNEQETKAVFRRIRFLTSMTATATPETATTPATKSTFKGKAPRSKLDVSAYKVGQQLDAKVVSALAFGIFVEVAPNVNALVPRSELSPLQFSRMTTMAKDKSADIFKVELISVSAENGTLSAKYVSGLTNDRSDFSSLEGKDILGKTFNATIVSKHNFGLFARVDDFKVDGLIPTFKVPRQMSADKVKVGARVVVKVDEVNVGAKKLVLSVPIMAQDVSALADLPADQWLTASVQSVTKFGLFVRPSGYDVSGLVFQSRVPRELLAILQQRISDELSLEDNNTDHGEVDSDHSTNTEEDNVATAEGENEATEEQQEGELSFEDVFSVGDVVRVRVQGIDNETGKLEFSMMPDSDDDEDFLPEFEQQESLMASMAAEEAASNREREANGEENVSKERTFRDKDGDFDSYEEDLDDAEDFFDPESVLLWWQGAPYVRYATVMEEQQIMHVDEDQESSLASTESRDMSTGTWRRRYEDDLREDVADSNSQALQLELKEIEDEIGDLGEFSDLLQQKPLGDSEAQLATPAVAVATQSNAFSSSTKGRIAFSLFSQKDASRLPAEWQSRLNTVVAIQAERPTHKVLKGGLKGDGEELDSLVKEIENEISVAESRMGNNFSNNNFKQAEAVAEEVQAAAEAVV